MKYNQTSQFSPTTSDEALLGVKVIRRNRIFGGRRSDCGLDRPLIKIVGHGVGVHRGPCARTLAALLWRPDRDIGPARCQRVRK